MILNRFNPAGQAVRPRGKANNIAKSLRHVKPEKHAGRIPPKAGFARNPEVRGQKSEVRFFFADL